KFNNTRCEYPENKTLYRLFEEQVERTPDSIAVVGQSPKRKAKNPEERQAAGNIPHTVTYRELNEQSHRLAILLIKKGVKADTIVGILEERSFEMIVGIFAVLKAGGAYLPIDPGYPEERKQYILKDSDAKILLTRQEIPGVSSPEAFNNSPKGAGDATPFGISPRKGDQLAYIIYTSGSTGKPKGVSVQQQSVVNILFGLQKDYPLNETDAYLFKTSYLFDVSVAEIFGWFPGGGRLVILEPGGEKDPGEIVEKIERENITHINFVPSMANIFIDVLKPGDIVKLSGLRYLLIAGEVLLPELVNKLKKLPPAIKMKNLYG
ncbi:MAG: amino acid adenylation domain-containing protein, partial [bacterium]|nr:amino acid adenylation domain-containing protein [bacterium]